MNIVKTNARRPCPTTPLTPPSPPFLLLAQSMNCLIVHNKHDEYKRTTKGNYCPLATLQHHKPKTTKMKERGELLGCSYNFVNNQGNDAKLNGSP